MSDESLLTAHYLQPTHLRTTTIEMQFQLGNIIFWRLLTACYLLPATFYLLHGAHYWVLAIYCLFPTLVASCYLLPIVGYSLCLLPATWYGRQVHILGVGRGRRLTTAEGGGSSVPVKTYQLRGRLCLHDQQFTTKAPHPRTRI